MPIDYSYFTQNPVNTVRELLSAIVHPKLRPLETTSTVSGTTHSSDAITTRESNLPPSEEQVFEIREDGSFRVEPPSRQGYGPIKPNAPEPGDETARELNHEWVEETGDHASIPGDMDPELWPIPQGHPKPPTPIPAKNETPALFALIIGINEYQSDHVTNLKGAVPDADAFREYLESTLCVPRSQIRNLRNEQATRAAIIQALQDLRSDSRIKPGDPIAIFYAGHGGETNAPTGWEAGGKRMQMLIPHDFRCQLKGREVYGVPDRSVGALLTDLAEVKGDNITVIFDCCHSGSATRKLPIAGITILERWTTVPNNVPDDLDKDIWQHKQKGKPRSTVIPQGFLSHGLRSHVLLAACGERETAKEQNGRGIFTQALLNEIAITGPDKLTYSELFKRIPSLPQQNPQCEGFNVHRILFNSKVPSTRRVLHTVQQDGDKYIMSAGTAHGITDGAEFIVYSEQTSHFTTPPLGNLVVLNASAFTSIMDVPSGSTRFPLPQPAFALQTKNGEEADLRIHVMEDEKLTDVFHALSQEMEAMGSDRRRILLVEKDHAELGIEIENGQVIFNMLNKLVTRFGLTRIPHSVPLHLGNLAPIICAAADFQWNLRRTHRNEVLQKKVRIEVRTIEQLEDDANSSNKVLQASSEDLNCGGIVDVVGGQKMYGFKIINDTDVGLYPALFYFDNSDLSITPYYLPSVKGNAKVDVPLPPKGSLTVGYGSGGSSPFSFVLPAGTDVDVGFLKLFLSTEHVDYSKIPQASPFLTTPPQNLRLTMEVRPKPRLVWDSILVTVVIRQALPQYQRASLQLGTL